MSGQAVEVSGAGGEIGVPSRSLSHPTQPSHQQSSLDLSASSQGRPVLTAAEKLFLFRDYLASEPKNDRNDGSASEQVLITSSGWQPLTRVWEADLQQRELKMDRPVSLLKSFAHLANEYGVDGLAELLPDNTPKEAFVVLTRVGTALDEMNEQRIRVTSKSLPDFAEEISSFIDKADEGQRGSGESRVTPEDLELLRTMVARMAALEALRAKVVSPIVSAIREAGPPLALAGDGRATLFDSGMWNDCPNVTVEELEAVQQRGGARATAVDQQSVYQKTEEVLEYLMGLTFAQNSEAVFSPEAEDRLRDTIATHLSAGTPLPISMYLSLEKFPNPFDTLHAGVDLAEVAFVQQIHRHLGEIEQITGIRPTLHILNESAMSDCWHEVSADQYKEDLGHVIAAYNLQDQVIISPFNERYLIDLLVTQEPSRFGGEEGMYRAFEFVHNSHQAMMGAMHALSGKDGLSGLSAKMICDDPDVGDRVLAYVADREKVVLRDVNQGINSELAHSIDPQILFPLRMSAALYRDVVTHSKDAPLEENAARVGRDNLRSLAVDQAREQAITFKAIMHLRGFIEQETGISILPADTIRESITGAEGKLSWNVGRTPQVTAAILGHKGAPYAPHATGVLTSTGEIAVTHVHELLGEDGTTGLESRWQPVIARVGSLSIPTFLERA